MVLDSPPRQTNTGRPLRAAIYVRVSTEEQTYENQLPYLKDWAARRGMKVVVTFAENASAWIEGKQVELPRMLKQAYQRRFDCVLVWSLDRLSREGPLKILGLIHQLRGWGVPVISYQEPWTEAPGELGDLLYAVAGWAGEFYSKRLSANTKAGLQRMLASGVTSKGRKITQLGRPAGSKDKKKRRPRRAMR